MEKTVRESIKELKSLFKSFEVIIVEDKSEDRSPQIASGLAKKFPSVKLVYNPINLGQGLSFLIGLKQSCGDLVMQNGVDRPFAIKDLKRLLPLFRKYDIVVVERSNRAAYGFWRKFTSYANIILRGLLFGFSYKDLNFVQIYKKKVFKGMEIRSISAAFVTQEIVLRAVKKGFRIKEVVLPYQARKGGVAHHGKRKDILWAFIDMVNFWFDSKKL